MVPKGSGRLVARFGVLACALLALAPRPVRAWTNTQPASATAHVHVWPSGRALVRLTLELEVRGGWLSQFEIAGLDPGSVLDPDKPAWLLYADGRKARPSAALRPDGTLVLRFARADAPRRGRHLLGIAYVTRLSVSDTASGARRLQFALPAWRVDLDAVDVWVNAPAQARWPSAEESALDGVVNRELRRVGGRTVLRAHRVSLPRTLPFTVEFDLPGGGPVRPELAGRAAPDAARPPLWLGALVLAASWLKRRAVLAQAARHGREPLALVRVPEGLRTTLMAALSIGGALCHPRSAPLGLVLLAGAVALALHRHVGAPRPAPAPRRLARAFDLLGCESWLDATTPPGFALLASLYTLSALRVAATGELGTWLELLLLITPLWLTGTRLHLAPEGAPAAEPRVPAPGPRTAVRPAAGAALRAPDRAA